MEMVRTKTNKQTNKQMKSYSVSCALNLTKVPFDLFFPQLCFTKTLSRPKSGWP